jgi:HEAT repeat protein
MRTQKLCSALAMMMFCGTAAANAADSNDAVDKAIDSLKTYDYGTDRNTLKPIDDAVVASYGKAADRKALEVNLVTVLTGRKREGFDAPRSRDAKDYCCRILRVIGTAECVPALAALLGDKDLSHSARYALQSIPAPEAGKALRDALPKLSGSLKIGVIGSLAARRDTECVAAMAECLTDTDKAIAAAAAHALGAIGTADASKALTDSVKTASAEIKPSIADACLECAERLLAGGDKTTAIAVYKSLSGGDQPKQVRLAATRGMISAAGK